MYRSFEQCSRKQLHLRQLLLTRPRFNRLFSSVSSHFERRCPSTSLLSSTYRRQRFTVPNRHFFTTKKSQTRVNDNIKGAIIKVHSITSPPDRIQPWQHLNQRQGTGSGFILSGGMILTNAHIIADSVFVTVTKHNSGIHYQAEVLHVGHECDIAMIRVLDERFYDASSDSESPTELELGDTPDLQDTVTVIGYPTGGESISVTEGVVSRIELIPYAHGATKLLGIQIDAAINGGNSGGPALKDGKVIGIAFQNMPDAENVGYIIPTPVIRHFLADVERFGGYSGFCGLGIHLQTLPDTKSFQKFLKMREEDFESGIVVAKVNPDTPADGKLKVRDVILAVDGKKINKDGSTKFRERKGERIAWEHTVQQKFAGDLVKLDVWRDSELVKVETEVRPIRFLVPVFHYDQPSPYYIYAGLVFTTLSQPYLHTWGEDWYNGCPRYLLEKALKGETKSSKLEEYVIICGVLPNKANMGSQRLSNSVIERVGEVDIKSLRHMKEVIESRLKSGDELIDFYLNQERVLVIDTQLAEETREHVLDRHRIPLFQSPDLEAVDASNKNGVGDQTGNYS